MKTISDIERLFEGENNPMVDFVLSQIKAGNIEERDGLIEMVIHLQQSHQLLHAEYQRLLAENAAIKIDRLIIASDDPDRKARITHEPLKIVESDEIPFPLVINTDQPQAESNTQSLTPTAPEMEDIPINEPQISIPGPEIKSEAEPPKERILPHRLKTVSPEDKKKRGWLW